MTIHTHFTAHKKPSMRLTDVLKQEHERIARALLCLSRLIAQLRVTNDVRPDAVHALLEFLRDYADHYHHNKEENELFPWMERHGLPSDAGPLAVMNADHEEGRDHLRHLLASAKHLQTDANARCEFAERAEQYCTLLFAHIDKENHVLYPMADRMGPGTSELYRAPSNSERSEEQRWESIVEHLENEARHWPTPTIKPRPGCCKTCD